MHRRTSRRLLTATLAVLVGLAAPAVFAAKKKPKPARAPEIDLGAATKGLAAIATGFLLVGERLRRRR